MAPWFRHWSAELSISSPLPPLPHRHCHLDSFTRGVKCPMVKAKMEATAIPPQKRRALYVTANRKVTPVKGEG